MKSENIKKGMTVKVLSYEDLLLACEEVDTDGDLIFEKESFVQEMQVYCGKKAKVVDVVRTGVATFVYLQFDGTLNWSGYTFTPKMLEMVDEGTYTYKPTIAFDFDGVIHSYETGWRGIDNCPDAPVKGIREVIKKLMDSGYRVVVCSSRCAQPSGLAAVEDYLEEYNIQVSDVVLEKPAAAVLVDDRAITFTGNTANLINRIKKFNPWYKKG